MYRPDEPTGVRAAPSATPPIALAGAADTGGQPAQCGLVGRIRRWDAELAFEFWVPAGATGTDIAAAAWRAFVAEGRRVPGWDIEIKEPVFVVEVGVPDWTAADGAGTQAPEEGEDAAA